MHSTIIVMYLYEGEKPNQSAKISTFVVTVGAILAGWESLDNDCIGFFLILATNLSQALQNVYTKRINTNNLVKPFGKYLGVG